MSVSRSVQYGFWAGLATVGFLLVFYLINPRLVFNSWVIWGSMAFYLVGMVAAVRRDAAGWTEGIFPFQQALKSAFTVYVVASLIYYTYYYLLFNVFDPGMTELQRTVVLEELEGMGPMLGEDTSEELISRYEEEGFEVTFSNLLLSLGQSLIGGFLMSLLVAAVSNPKS